MTDNTLDIGINDLKQIKPSRKRGIVIASCVAAIAVTALVAHLLVTKQPKTTVINVPVPIMIQPEPPAKLAAQPKPQSITKTPASEEAALKVFLKPSTGKIGLALTLFNKKLVFKKDLDLEVVQRLTK